MVENTTRKVKQLLKSLLQEGHIQPNGYPLRLILRVPRFSEMSETEITFLDTKVYKGVGFIKKSILYVQTPYKPTETFQ